METTKQTSKEFFKTLTIIHLALTFGLVFVGIIGSFLILSGKMTNNGNDLNKIFLYIVPIVSLGGLFFSNLIYKNKLSELKEKNDLNIKMTNFRGVLIVRYAFIEGPTFFAFVATILTGNLVFLAFIVLMILAMIYWRPTKNSVIADLELNYQEVEIINNPDSIIAEFSNTKRN